jgi:thiamine-monophosphate kinase
LIGGDTTSSNLGLVISITSIGEIDKGKSVMRNGAKVGDLLVVSGDVGAAFMGLQVLEREKEVFKVMSSYKSKLILYTYDSFTFDYDPCDGEQFFVDIKNAMK